MEPAQHAGIGKPVTRGIEEHSRNTLLDTEGEPDAIRQQAYKEPEHGGNPRAVPHLRKQAKERPAKEQRRQEPQGANGQVLVARKGKSGPYRQRRQGQLRERGRISCPQGIDPVLERHEQYANGIG